MYAKKTIALNMSVFRVHSSRFIYKCSSATIVNTSQYHVHRCHPPQWTHGCVMWQ